jgi:hypothetical protein
MIEVGTRISMQVALVGQLTPAGCQDSGVRANFLTQVSRLLSDSSALQLRYIESSDFQVLTPSSGLGM